MGSSIATAERSDPVRTLDNVGPGPVKAGLRSDRIGPSWNAAMKDAVVGYYRTVKEAAYALGQVDPSLMMREFDAGKFARFDAHADADAKACVVKSMHDALGKLDDPLTCAKRVAKEAHERINELMQIVEHFRS